MHPVVSVHTRICLNFVDTFERAGNARKKERFKRGTLVRGRLGNWNGKGASLACRLE